jgi:serine/threonine protein kinase/Flp pilus assembly protein TadD
MTGRERRERIYELQQAALSLPPERWAAFLDSACPGDGGLREEVLAGLRALDESPGSVPAAGFAVPVGVQSLDPLVSTLVGPYRIVEPVTAQGAMGTVYRAERSDAALTRQQVAVKVLRRGFDTDAFVRRFVLERSLLAQLRHAAIVSVFDAGALPDGRPYYVMEWIEDGLPLDEYCARHQLDLRARLGLFQRVCDAVHYAHQRSIVHRDLKPGNIVVTPDGHPKLLDFGLAKLLTEEGAPDLTFSAASMPGERLGTPAYASPEQASGDRVTQQSDVYALGVILFELLTGERPYRLAAGSWESMARMICESDAPMPSAVAGRAARSSVPTRELRGDLDAIVLCALRKEPERRYASVAHLRDDLNRYLANEPVLAQLPTKRYLAAKFVRRHRLAASLAAAGAFVLAAFGGAMTWQASRIALERDRANTQARIAERTLQFVTGLFDTANPSEAKGRTVTVREVLDRGRERLKSELADEPEVRATLFRTMGTVYRGLGLFGSAEPLLREALVVRQSTLGARHPLTLESMYELGAVRFQQGDSAEAGRLFRDTLAAQEQVLGPLDPRTLTTANDLGVLLKNEGKLEEAERYYRQALEGSRQTRGEQDPNTITMKANLGMLLQARGNLPEAERYAREALDARRRVLGENHPDTLIAINNVGFVLASGGQFEASVPFHREALERRRRVLGPEHPDTVRSLNNLSRTLALLGRFDEAERPAREALEGWRRSLGDGHPMTLTAMTNLALLLRDAGRPDDALPLVEQVHAVRRRTLGESHADTLAALVNLGDVEAERGRLGPAQAMLEKALDAARAALPPTHWVIGSALTSYGRCLTRLGRHDAAEKALVEARGLLTSNVSLGARVASSLKQLAAARTRGAPAAAALR